MRSGRGQAPARNPLHTTTRVILQAAGLTLGVFIFLQRLDIGPACTGPCRAVQDSPFSGILLAALLVGNLGALILEFQDDPALQRKWGLGLGVASLIAFGWMVSLRSFSTLCFLAQALWLLLGIEALSRKAFVRTLVALVPLSCLAFPLIRDANRPLALPTVFALRNGERLRREPPLGMVIFCDPVAPSFRNAVKGFNEAEAPLPVVYRWRIAEEHRFVALNLAAAIESALRRDPQKGAVLRRRVFLDPAGDEYGSVAHMAKEAGFSLDEVREWLKHPEKESLAAIAQDEQLGDALGIGSAPALGKLDLPMAQQTSPNVRRLGVYEFGIESAWSDVRLDAFRPFVRPGGIP